MPGRRNDDRDERVSMAGADPEAVLRALLQVDPESDPVNDDDGEHGERKEPCDQD